MKAHGLGHFPIDPRELPLYQYERVRIFKKGSHVDRLYEAMARVSLEDEQCPLTSRWRRARARAGGNVTPGRTPSTQNGFELLAWGPLALKLSGQWHGTGYTLYIRGAAP
jgi:hypothetical protein